MKYAATYRQWLLSPPAIHASDAALGAHLRLNVYCAELELGEGEGEIGDARIAGCVDWNDRVWIQATGGGKRGVKAAVDAGLATWRGRDLLVHGYDLAGQRAVIGKRRGGKLGGRPKKPQDTETGNHRFPETEPERPAKDNLSGNPLPSSPSLPFLPPLPSAEVEGVDGRDVARAFHEQSGSRWLGSYSNDIRSFDSVAAQCRQHGGDPDRLCELFWQQVRAEKPGPAQLAKMCGGLLGEMAGATPPAPKSHYAGYPILNPDDDEEAAQ